ncbi:MAG TPA: CGNR zinc finger domain-containing protein [Gaiellaceae bacterium]|nr:CGNR zinc finger domain-containing protein [Gaiellaceae bacterium]
MAADLQLVCDFVNSAELEDGSDELADARGLVRWLSAHGLAGEHARATDADAAEARALREALRELMRANNGEPADHVGAAALLDASGRRAALAVRFDTGSIRLVPRERGVRGALGIVLGAAGEAMANGSWRRAKACRSDTCRWAFVDHSRNQSRQWCSMSVCGNRAKARTFRERHG